MTTFLSRGERVFQTANALVLILLSLIFIIPFLLVFSTSFVSPEEYAVRGPFILIPRVFDLGAYKLLLSGGSIVRAYGITFFRTIVGTLLQLIATSTMAYALSKSDLPGRKYIISLLVIAIVFPVQIIPLFLLVKTLGLSNSIWSLIWPWLINTQYVFIMIAFFRQIPDSLEESARIEGCSHFQIYLRIILPLSVASMVTIGLFYAVWHWNSWFDAAMFIHDGKKLPMQNILRSILLGATSSDMIATGETAPPSESLKGAAIIITALPILMVYPYIQKYFVKGFMVGSVKG